MTAREHHSLPLFLALVIFVGLAPREALGAELSDEKPLRLYAAGELGPIGRVYSLSGAAIDGRLTYGEQKIWGGELIEVAEGTSASVRIDSVGEVRLTRGAAIKMATMLAALTDYTARPFLVASLTRGEILVRLDQEAGAYIQSRGSAFTARCGASFNLAVGEGEARVDVINGLVIVDSYAMQREYIVESVIVEPTTGRPIGPGRTQFRVPPNGDIRVAFQVKEKTTKKPAGRGRRVVIALGKPGVGQIGSQSTTVLTNDFGAAMATFTAGPNRGSTPITATDEESGARWQGLIEVAPPGAGIFRARNVLLMSAAAAAIVVVEWPREKGPLRQVPPPRIP